MYYYPQSSERDIAELNRQLEKARDNAAKAEARVEAEKQKAKEAREEAAKAKLKAPPPVKTTGEDVAKVGVVPWATKLERNPFSPHACSRLLPTPSTKGLHGLPI